MIIQSFVKLAAALLERDRANPDATNRLPVEGFIHKRIGYVINLDQNGNVITLDDIRSEKRSFAVPMLIGRTTNIVANLLWDKIEYALGLGDSVKTPLRFAEFHRKINDLPAEIRDVEGVKAVLLFLSNHNPATFRATYFGENDDLTANVAFRLDGADDLVCQCEAVQNYIAQKKSGSQSITCMITGKPGEIARIHQNFQGIYGAAKSGANLIAFNTDEIPAVSYYGREQGNNAPITEDTVKAYSSALRYALEPKHKLRFRLLNNVMIAWANTPTLYVSPVIEILGQFEDNQLGQPPSPKIQNANEVQEILHAANLGVTASDLDADYYIIGLTGVQARIAISFFQHGRLGDLVQNANDWHADFTLDGRHPLSRRSGRRIFDILTALAPSKSSGKKDLDKLAPYQQTQLLFAALNGTLIPTTVVKQALVRLRVSGYPDDEHTLISLIKLYLNRNLKKEFSVSLDNSRTNPGYLYGRLFSIIERAQVKSVGRREINASVRDKFWSSASTTPTRVFPILNKLFINYLKRAKKSRHWLEREYAAVTSLIKADDITDSFDQVQQMEFALGYWQQRVALWPKENSEVLPEEVLSEIV